MGGSSYGGALESADAGSGEAGDLGDSIAPRIVSITPRDDAAGVLSSAAIELRFSQAMNRASVASALTVSEFLPDDLDLVWDSQDTHLTVKPIGGFEYAAVTDQTGPALVYSVMVGTQARDAMGNHLRSVFASSFSTLRNISQHFGNLEAAEYNTYGGGSGDNVHPCQGNPTYRAKVGRFHNSAVAGTFFVFVPVDLTSLGDPSLLSAVNVRFSAAQADPDGAFYPDGSVLLDKVSYGPIDNDVGALQVTDGLGAFCSSASTTSPSSDLSGVLWTAYQSGEQRQLYRLSADANPENTDAAFRCDGFDVVVNYRMP